jgi:hypothetical protein
MRGTRLVVMAIMAVMVAGQFYAPPPAIAGGISVDGGLTPAQGRVILRTRLAYLQRASSWSSKPSTEMFMVPFVAAWGVLPELTLMARTSVNHMKMSMADDGMMAGGDTSKTGMGDLLFQAKYKLYRWNSRKFVFGVAPTLGLEFPTGSDGFTSESLDLRTGLHITSRWYRLNADFTAAYVWNGMVGGNFDSGKPGDELQMNLALSHVFAIPGAPTLALSPVLEFSAGWEGVENGMDSDGLEAFFYVSPGLLFITRWVILEALVQLPVWQENPAGTSERNIGLITGLRFLL